MENSKVLCNLDLRRMYLNLTIGHRDHILFDCDIADKLFMLVVRLVVWPNYWPVEADHHHMLNL